MRCLYRADQHNRNDNKFYLVAIKPYCHSAQFERKPGVNKDITSTVMNPKMISEVGGDANGVASIEQQPLRILVNPQQISLLKC